MKYIITNLTKNNDNWSADVEYWQNCRCNSQKKTVYIESDTKPSKLEVLRVFNGN